MNNSTAEILSRKVRALKHCNKVLDEIKKKGSAIITLNCTGVSFVVRQGDAIYLQLETTRAQLAQDIGSYEIIRRTEQATRRYAPAPVGASPIATTEELLEQKRAKAREAARKWYAKNKEKKAAYQRVRRELKKSSKNS